MAVRRSAGGWATGLSCGIFLDLAVLTSESGDAEVLGVLRYDRDDPFAVRLDCHADGQPPVVWRFARETLEAGVRGRAGAGSVLVCNGMATGPDQVYILLCNPDAHCVLRGSLEEFEVFLARTRQVVPYGREREHVELDAYLAELTGEDRYDELTAERGGPDGHEPDGWGGAR
ncbi:SsgA family sporulation/cell division regulator [Actinospica durhamensis]|uniref:SsgA family sporulation/cell division regulator n=1 Tax=Actinospica durhamensis TaxID=1508375 RepID=A0A941IUC6_9ACTN|nr:SsgA family sporulation/cell division regulator [Actinospica durhamensis]MBR7837268.1 SsgA family sporulation/cell division regulator [Actinospica durhamensis]